MEKYVKDVVREWLGEHDYQGLASDRECGCGLDDLMCCGEYSGDCRPAYEVHWDNCPVRLEDEHCFQDHETDGPEPSGGCTCWCTEKPKEPPCPA